MLHGTIRSVQINPMSISVSIAHYSATVLREKQHIHTEVQDILGFKINCGEIGYSFFAQHLLLLDLEVLKKWALR